ncbi:MAG: hypothetical protein WKG07_35440 [Hymenobacter sp.]
MSYYQFIDQERVAYPVRRLCQILDVPPAATTLGGSGRPASWSRWPPRAGKRPWSRLLSTTNGATAPVVCAPNCRPKATAWVASACARPCGERGLRALQPRAYTPRTTDSTHGLRCAPNLLLGQPAPTQA